MKIIATILLAITLLAPVSAFARDISELSITVVPKEKDLRKVCTAGKYSTLNGCFNKPNDHLYIRSNMDDPEFVMVFFHEMGHFYTEDKKTSELRLFRKGKQKESRENAAEDFAIWMTAPYLLSKDKTEFFNSLGADKQAIIILLIKNWN